MGNEDRACPSTQSLGELCAERFAGQDWHNMSAVEREIVKVLEETGYLSRNIPPNGFTGKALPSPEQKVIVLGPKSVVGEIELSSAEWVKTEATSIGIDLYGDSFYKKLEPFIYENIDSRALIHLRFLLQGGFGININYAYTEPEMITCGGENCIAFRIKPRNV